MFIFYLTKFKWVITGVASSAAAIAAILAVLSYYETKGYNRAINELAESTAQELKAATDKAILKANKDMQEALNKQQAIFDSELVRAKEEALAETKYIEVIEYVDKVEIRDVCSTVDDSIIELLNKSISNSNGSGS